MDAENLFLKIKKIELKAKFYSKSILIGEHHSSFKGTGLSIKELREYQLGDDIRSINWNVTAKTNKIYVKEYEEERDLTVILLIDISKSLNFTRNKVNGREYIAEISAVLSFIADQNKDKIGAILFSNKVERYIPPQKGKNQILKIIKEVLTCASSSTYTDISFVLKHLLKTVPRCSVVFLISDFLSSTDFFSYIPTLCSVHTLMAIQVYDDYYLKLPPVGLLRIKDLESNEELILDTNDLIVMSQLRNRFVRAQVSLKESFLRNKINFISLKLGSDYVIPFARLLNKKQN